MRLSLKSLAIVFLIGIVVQVLPGGSIAAESEYLDVPMPRQFMPVIEADGSPRYVSARNIEQEIRKYSQKLGKFYRNQKIEKFIVADGDWLKHLLAVYDALLYETSLRGEAETWDCENYSSLLNALSTISVWRAGYMDTKAAIGWLRVDAKEPWAGLPGIMHALIFAVTRKGIYIIEPQNGQYIPLSEYPNRQYIEEVYLF